MTGPMDGHAVTYWFGTDHYQTWKVTATSLQRAIRLFRVGALFPESYAGKDGMIHIHLTLPGEKGRRGEYTDVAQIPPEATEEEGLVEEVALRASALLGQAGMPSETTALAPQSARPIQSAPRVHLEAKMRELEAAQKSLEAMRRQLSAGMDKLKAELTRRMEQLWIIELFLGSQEQVTVLREGAPAPEGTPITVRQAVLCMDEEIAVHDWLHHPERVGTFDYTGITGFDAWLVQDPTALAEIFPWPKGIVALRVRRLEKDRGPVNDLATAMQHSEEAEADRMTYLLLRNGEQLYRLWVDVDLWPHLFPSAQDALAAQPREEESLADRFAHGDPGRARKRIKQQVAGLIALQGILERSTLLHPLPVGINVFDPTQEGTNFQLVRDGEAVVALTDDQDRLSRIRWRDSTIRVPRPDAGPGCYDTVVSEQGYQGWLRGQLAAGIRVFYTGTRYGSKDSPLSRRTGIDSIDVWPKADEPYTIVSVFNKDRWYGELEFLYLPDQDVYREDADGYIERAPRQRRVRFQCYRDEVLPVDFLSWRVLEHLIRDRSQREHYGEFFRVAFSWWKLAKAESERERPFVDLVLHRCGAPLEEGPDRARCERLVRWWKIKTKEHRTLSTDEAKALRMIEAAFRRGDDHDNDPETRLFQGRARK